MIENLVIVESPAKAKTIEKFLGDGYTVKSRFRDTFVISKKRIWELISNTIFNLNMKSPLIKKRLSKN